MLTESEFALWCARVGLPTATIDLTRNIRNFPPSRRIGGGLNNVPTFYPSRKMKCVIQAESHTVSFPLVYALEFDDDVLEYYCEPSAIRLEYGGPSGRRVVAAHTPDYFVIRQQRAGWIEAKDADELPILEAESPNRYQLIDNRWRCPPGERFAGALGLSYDLHSSAYIEPTFTRNAQFLSDFLRVPDAVPSSVSEIVFDILSRRPAITLEELLIETAERVDPDRIYQMIAVSMIYVNFSAVPLVEPDRVRIFADPITGAQFHAASRKNLPDTGVISIVVGRDIVWDGKPWKVINVGQHNVYLLDPGGTHVVLPERVVETLVRDGTINGLKADGEVREHNEVQRRLNTASPRDLAVADARMKRVQRFLELEKRPRARTMDRNLRRYVSLYKQAERDLGNGYVGLIPRISGQGNRTSRLGGEQHTAMMNHIKSDYERKQQPTKYASWITFRETRKSAGLPWPSYRTFCKAVNRRPRAEQTEKRKSRRAAYRFKEFVWRLDRQTPRHGDRPFEIAHIDHTELDVELLSHKSGKNLGRPWLTLMMDAFDRRVLAHFVTFDPPSNRSTMMVIRDCIRRHNRMPQIIVVDGGKEFSGRYFEHVLARYEITKKQRPPADPRVGSVLERLFGTTNTTFIHNLRGNTQITRDVRQTTVSSDPKLLAVWDLLSLDNRLENYFYDVYDTLEHPALGVSPRDAFTAAITMGPPRKHLCIAYDSACLMTTAPSTAKGTAKMLAGRGVVINYFLYWAEEFRDPLVEGKQVHVRFDPWNSGIAWAYVHNHWVECHSQHYAEMKDRTQKEVQIASDRLLDRMRRYSHGRTTVTASTLAEFLRNVEQDEQILMQRLRDIEGVGIRDKILNRLKAEAQAEPDVPWLIQSAPAEYARQRQLDDVELCDDL